MGIPGVPTEAAVPPSSLEPTSQTRGSGEPEVEVLTLRHGEAMGPCNADLPGLGGEQLVELPMCKGRQSCGWPGCEEDVHFTQDEVRCAAMEHLRQRAPEGLWHFAPPCGIHSGRRSRSRSGAASSQDGCQAPTSGPAAGAAHSPTPAEAPYSVESTTPEAQPRAR